MAQRKIKLSPEAISRLEKVKAKILKKPSNFNMGNWHCGTVACIAGHLCIDAKLRPAKHDLWEVNPHKFVPSFYCARQGHELLGLTYYETRTFNEGDVLFLESCWPEEFRDAYYQCETNRQRAEVAACRIDYFIATGK